MVGMNLCCRMMSLLLVDRHFCCFLRRKCTENIVRTKETPFSSSTRQSLHLINDNVEIIEKLDILQFNRLLLLRQTSNKLKIIWFPSSITIDPKANNVPFLHRYRLCSNASKIYKNKTNIRRTMHSTWEFPSIVNVWGTIWSKTWKIHRDRNNASIRNINNNNKLS